MDSDNRNSNDATPNSPSSGEESGFRVKMVGPSRKRTWILAGVVVAAVLFLVGSVVSFVRSDGCLASWTQE